MRLIDADPIERALFKLADKSLAKNPYENARICAFRRALELVLNAPTIAPPPNDPLTLEELLKTENPVWCRVDCLPNKGFWCLCNHGAIITPSVQEFFAEDIDFSLWRFYRRKPEEGPASSDGEAGPQRATEPWKDFLMTRFERREGPV